MTKFLPGDSWPGGEPGLRVMLWNRGVILCGWGLLNNCVGVCPNSRICVSMAIRWSGSAVLHRRRKPLGQLGHVAFGTVCSPAQSLPRPRLPVVVHVAFVRQGVKDCGKREKRQPIISFPFLRLRSDCPALNRIQPGWQSDRSSVRVYGGRSFVFVFTTIMGGDGFAASLLVAKHQVDPLVQVLRHVLALQRHPVLLQEILGICVDGIRGEFVEGFLTQNVAVRGVLLDGTLT